MVRHISQFPRGPELDPGTGRLGGLTLLAQITHGDLISQPYFPGFFSPISRSSFHTNHWCDPFREGTWGPNQDRGFQAILFHVSHPPPPPLLSFFGNGVCHLLVAK